MKNLIFVLFFFPLFVLQGQVFDEQVKRAGDSFYDERENYSRFSGRITDKDKKAEIYKIKTENPNISFFRAGDVIFFQVANFAHEKKINHFSCRAFVRSVEKEHFVVFVNNKQTCHEGKSFLRGTAVTFHSPQLAERMFTASQYRRVLLQKRVDFLHQLNKINNFLWNYKEEKRKSVMSFEKKINAIKKERQEALDDLVDKQREYIVLQRDLQQEIDDIDHDLENYRIKQKDLFFDRWHLDHDSIAKFNKRPSVRE